MRVHDTVGEVKARIAAFGELDADLAPSDLRLRLDGVELLDDGAKLSACGAAAPDALSRLDVVVRAAPLPVEAGGASRRRRQHPPPVLGCGLLPVTGA